MFQTQGQQETDASKDHEHHECVVVALVEIIDPSGGYRPNSTSECSKKEDGAKKYSMRSGAKIMGHRRGGDGKETSVANSVDQSEYEQKRRVFRMQYQHQSQKQQ